MNAVILAEKYRGETMGVCMHRVRQQYSLDLSVPMTYVGRLDPHAEGLVIFLVGRMRFSKERFLGLDKQYRISFILGITTDSGDLMGIPTPAQDWQLPTLSRESLLDFQPIGTFIQQYPHFSSRKVDGKPLFQLTRSNNQPAVLPTHTVSLNNLSCFSYKAISRDVLMDTVITDCKTVVGDFRQDEISNSWMELSATLPEVLSWYQVTLDVSSGFYVRQWVTDLGNFLSTGAVTFSIIRETIGIFTRSMMQGGEVRVVYEDDPILNNLTD